MRRHLARPYGHSISRTRTISLLMALAVLWMLYGWIKEPATWRWMATLDETPHAANIPSAPDRDAHAAVTPPEVIVPGPNDLDPDSMREFRSRLELITDRTALKPREMPLYWKLMQWSRTQSFHKLERRAARTSTFSQLWEQPAQSRGQLVRLRLHVRRVLHYTAPDNPLGLKDVYEAWGWTDESKSFPYVVVFPDKPPGLPVGGEVRGEIVFVGYFLKIMSYTAFDVTRGAPLLVGRAHSMVAHPAPPKQNSPAFLIWAIPAVGIVFVCGIAFRHLRRIRSTRPRSLLPDSLTGMNEHPQTIGPISNDTASASFPLIPFESKLEKGL